MSFVVVTMVYVLVFLGGEGLTSDQIRADSTKDFQVVNRFWLRVSRKQANSVTESLTRVQDAIRSRHLLGHIHRNRPDSLRKGLRPLVREKTHRPSCLLGFHWAHCGLVHMVVGWLDQHVPSAWKV